jgi:hypothetical protein
VTVPGWLVDDEARDVSRLTGIPWFFARIHQRGAEHPCIDLGELDGWDRLRVAFAQIGAHYYLDTQGVANG